MFGRNISLYLEKWNRNSVNLNIKIEIIFLIFFNMYFVGSWFWGNIEKKRVIFILF